MSQYSYIGKGSIYAGIAGKLLPIGNTSALTLSAEEDKKELQDYENAGGGVIDTVSRISRVGLSMTVHNISPENLAIALRGAATATGAGSVSNEAATAYVGGLTLLARIPDPAQSLTVTYAGAAAWAAETAYALGTKIVDTGHIYVVTVAGTSDDAEPTWPTDGSTVVDGTVTWKDLGVVACAENTDYTRVRAGIIAKAGGKLADGDAVTVSYSALPDNVVQAMVNSGLEYHLVFDGLNEAKSGKPVIVDAFKVKFNPAQALNLIGDEFAELVIEGDVIKDDTKSGAGISQYFTVRMAQL